MAYVPHRTAAQRRADAQPDDRSPERRALDDADRLVDLTRTDYNAAVAAADRAAHFAAERRHDYLRALATQRAAQHALRDA